MDSNDKPAGQSSQLPGIAAVALLLGLILIPETPFKPTRPSMPDGYKASTEDVRSRLWQDPFAAVHLHRDKYHNKHSSHEENQAKKAFNNKDPNFAYYFDHTPQRICNNTEISNNTDELHDAHSLEDLRCQVQRDTAYDSRKGSDLHVLGVMVPGGPYAEDAERRLRSRYAVVSGLASSGYIPVDAEHIGYVDLSDQCLDAIKENNQGKTFFCDWPSLIPYEWFKPISNDSNKSLDKETKKANRILILWLDNGALARDKPLNILGHLNHLITPQEGDNLFLKKDYVKVGFDVLGPNDSDTLQQMYHEI
ncbi:MAG: hypothetical protein OEX11_03190, partial [Nitrosomonas sp.]|nr:hypothetical protein [Nitrosomonas sp.]